MNALDTLMNIAETKLCLANLKYCLVSKDKHPYKLDGSPCRPNVDTDFVDLEDLANTDLENYAGIGISITASRICAIDVDKCFSKAFDISSADDRATYFIDKFKDVAYIEFSFSGTGLRILFETDNIEDYSKYYYIKNSLVHIEYYQACGSARYVTVTGKTISDIEISHIDVNIVKEFLEKYMKKQFNVNQIHYEIKEETRTLDELLFEVRKLYIRNGKFLDLWFGKAPGSKKNESELDYELLTLIFEKITTDKEMIRQVFEASDYYKSKDAHHIQKWTYNNYRYLEFQYDMIRRNH